MALRMRVLAARVGAHACLVLVLLLLLYSSSERRSLARKTA